MSHSWSDASRINDSYYLYARNTAVERTVRAQTWASEFLAPCIVIRKIITTTNERERVTTRTVNPLTIQTIANERTDTLRYGANSTIQISETVEKEFSWNCSLSPIYLCDD